ncbi:MAG: hypothetical protein KH382_04200 [Clostridiales bacterium]|nr:hypothetical protein [Clostridiales bacterium]
MTDILLVGTFHFFESSFDFYSAEVQQELALWAQKLLPFHPDAVAVEAAVHAQNAVTSAYHKFHLSDLKNPDKMRNETLGEITIFGQVCPITYNNEAIQIGYRVGKLLDLPDIYAVDDDLSFDMSVMNTPSPSLAEARQAYNADISRHRKDSIMELYQYYNSETYAKLSHSTYIKANAVSGNRLYTGAEMVSKWYERNLKIFSNIQRLAYSHERILILYGAGHLPILKELIRADDSLKLADINYYL